MKVLQIGPKSIHVEKYVSAISKKGLACYLTSEEVCDFSGIELEKTISFRSLNPLKLLSSYGDLKRFVKAVSPDIIHIHQVNRMAYFATKIASRMNIPVVTTAWGSDVLVVPNKNGFFKFLVTKTLRRSHVITADSKDMIAKMQLLEPNQNKYHLVQYGIDPIQAIEKEEIIFSNRLHEVNYRLPEIIHYFNDFKALNPTWKLVIGGTGSLTNELKKLVNQLELNKDVLFVGWLNAGQNAEFYSKSSIYVSIPESDGTSVSVLEAMSAGCIPVVPNIEVSKEWVKDGVNGVIESQDKNPFSEAIKIDPIACSKINHEIITKSATRDACVSEFYKLYKKLDRNG